MVTSCIVGMWTKEYESGSTQEKPYISKPIYFRLKGFGILLGASLFSQALHSSVTIIGGPLKDKKNLKKVFGGTFSTTLLLYSVLSIICSLYFGNETKSIVTLNWQGYMSGSKSNKALITVIKYVISLFPVFDILSIYPLCSITLAFGLQNLFFPGSFDKKDPKSLRIKILFRFFSALVPILGSLIVKEIKLIIIFDCFFGSFISFLIPVLLQIKSKKTCKLVLKTEKTPYSGCISSDIIAKAIFIVGVIGLCGSLVFSIYEQTYK
ncbi:hypothetical protein M0812_12523 [Anaeramoeba flamelloides]|uniref:Amino acid transporter transmembrane domain-containing protein n=1 Tax=Anaeramoeba flamelloides TaxID=1746091 RepID=A0AAV7ZQ48_9EUKA|nr:hypothetical protein M0812_12523 [Anaeramoeba flamelloides]